MPSSVGDLAVAQAPIQHHDELFLALGQLGLAGGDAGLFFARVGGEQAVDGGGDFAGGAGLFDVEVGAGLDAGLFGFTGRHGGDDHQGHFLVHAFDLAHRAGALDTRQQQIEDEQLGLPVFDDGRLQFAELFEFNHFGGGAQTTQQHGQSLTHQRMIVDHVHAHRVLLLLKGVVLISN